MTNFITVGRPGYFGSRKEEILNNYDKVYGKDNWRITHHVEGKYLEVKDWDKDFRFKGDELYFITSNNGKFISATNALKDVVRLAKFELDIKEEQDSVEKIASHKARVAYSVLCKPVICDDSGFVIEQLNGYPGHHVGRELKSKGLEYFLDLAKQHGPLDSYWPMTVSYMDETLDKPKLFTSKVRGKLISEARGNPKSPNLKSQLGLAFIVEGQTKTIAEMTAEEYHKYARSDRWGELAEFLKGRK